MESKLKSIRSSFVPQKICHPPRCLLTQGHRWPYHLSGHAPYPAMMCGITSLLNSSMHWCSVEWSKNDWKASTYSSAVRLLMEGMTYSSWETNMNGVLVTSGQMKDQSTYLVEETKPNPAQPNRSQRFGKMVQRSHSPGAIHAHGLMWKLSLLTLKIQKLLFDVLWHQHVKRWSLLQVALRKMYP